MGFLDKAKAAATELASKADTALASSGVSVPGTSTGDVDKHLHDLGLLAYLDATGRPAPADERERVLAGLRDLEARGALRSFTLRTAAPQAPPPPGAVAGGHAAPPPPGASAPPAPVPPAAPAPPAAAPPAPAPAAPAPPPPTWAQRGDA